MPGVVGAFIRREEAQRGRDQSAYVVVASRARGAQERFQLGEGELDRIEIRTVRRKESNARARLLDGHPHLGLLMNGEVIEYDDIARAQSGNQDLFNVGKETRTIDGPIEHGGRAEALETERGDHGVRLPVTAGSVIMEPCAAWAPAVAT